MNAMTNSSRPVRIFLGSPQSDKIQVYKVGEGRQVVMTQAIFTNTSGEDAELTITINTTDVMKNYKVPAGKTEILNMYVVLNEGDAVNLQQNTNHAINVTLNGNFA